MPEVLAIIGARGGSKGLPRKNVILLGGKPLIAWTIDAARGARDITRTVITTDNHEIADTARQCGAEVPFMRPDELAQDSTPGLAAVLHAVRWLDDHEGYRPDVVVNLQPTSPLRTSSDIDAAMALLRERQADAVVSVSPADQHPYWMKTVDSSGWMKDFIEQREATLVRQKLPAVYALNGAIYLAHREVLLSTGSWYTDRTAAYIMPFERSIDIDTAWDFADAERVLQGARG